MPNHKMITSLLLLTALLLCGGCGDDETTIVEPPVITPPGHATPDLMVAAFRLAYEDMDYKRYIDLLRADYEMLLQAETQQEFPDVGPAMGRAAEMRIAGRMFAGQPVTNPDGYLVPGISSIDFRIFAQRGAWAEVADGLPFAGSQVGVFDVDILCARTGYSFLRAQGQLRIFAAASDTTISGRDFTFWQLSGMQDLTSRAAKGIEGTTWGGIKSLFWVPE